MESAKPRWRLRSLALASMIVFVVAAAAAPHAAAAPPRTPSVDIQSAAVLAPDGATMTVELLVSCPERWTVVEGRVEVTQPQASGQGSFTLVCTGATPSLRVDVRATTGTFTLDDATASAVLVIQRGKTATATDSSDLFVQPGVDLAFTGAARLDGGDVLIDLTVGCPVGAEGRQSYVNITGEQGSGNGNYVPVCDGVTRTITVRVAPSQGVFVPGCARAFSAATVVHDSLSFTAFAETLIEIGV